MNFRRITIQTVFAFCVAFGAGTVFATAPKWVKTTLTVDQVSVGPGGLSVDAGITITGQRNATMSGSIDSNFFYINATGSGLRNQTAGGWYLDVGGYTSTIGSGSNAFAVGTNGARIDHGAGASDYSSSDGTTVTYAGPLASASSVRQFSLGIPANSLQDDAGTSIQVFETGRGAFSVGSAAVTFHRAFSWPPDCFCNDTGGSALACSPQESTNSTTGITFLGTGSNTFKWLCVGNR